MTPRAIPPEFIDAAIAEITAVGYYRTDPKIEMEIVDNTISLTSTSNIVPFNQTARITPPKARAAKGLKSIEQVYLVGGKAVKAPFDVSVPISDHFRVKFQRKSDSFKRIEDTHQWTSPVTSFKVTFKFSANHKCNLDKLLMVRPGLTLKQIATGHWDWAFPDASFSGQGFDWSVEWL